MLKRRLVDHHRHSHREKRGAGKIVSLETAAVEAGLSAVSADATPEEVFDHQWALSLLHLSLTRMERDYAAAGRTPHFLALVPFLGLGDAPPDSTHVQKSLGLSASAARQAVHRFRDRFRRHLRDEIAQTIASTDDAAIDRELEGLQNALRRSRR